MRYGRAVDVLPMLSEVPQQNNLGSAQGGNSGSFLTHQPQTIGQAILSDRSLRQARLVRAPSDTDSSRRTWQSRDNKVDYLQNSANHSQVPISSESETKCPPDSPTRQNSMAAKQEALRFQAAVAAAEVAALA